MQFIIVVSVLLHCMAAIELKRRLRVMKIKALSWRTVWHCIDPEEKGWEPSPMFGYVLREEADTIAKWAALWRSSEGNQRDVWRIETLRKRHDKCNYLFIQTWLQTELNRGGKWVHVNVANSKQTLNKWKDEEEEEELFNILDWFHLYQRSFTKEDAWWYSLCI